MTDRFDAIIIGTGQAGPSLAGRLTDKGMRVAIIERNRFGGTCVNNGCIPTKTMVASAYAAFVARRAAEYGVVVDGEVRVDMKKVKARKDAVSGRSNKGVETWLKGMERCRVIEGHARFESPRTIAVNGEVLEADRIFINVGGRALIPPMPGLDQVPFLTNASLMHVDFLPEHLVIVGGSYIGLEFGQAFRRFGSQVTIVEKGPRLISREDPDVSEAVQQILEKEGIAVRTNATCMTVSPDPRGVTVHLDCEANREVTGTHLLLAVGRVPNTHDLGLDLAGVRVDARGYIEVDDRLQTSVSGIWALGDCNGRGAFTHTSYNDHEIVADNLLNGDDRKVTDRIQTYALFVDPPLGRCGMTEAEVRASGRKALIATYPMKRVSRAVEKGETEGFMKILVDADSGSILGASILGTGGDEVIQMLLYAMYAKTPYRELKRIMHIHPTVSEFMPTVLAELRPLAP